MKIDAVETARIPPINASVITGLAGLELISISEFSVIMGGGGSVIRIVDKFHHIYRLDMSSTGD